MGNVLGINTINDNVYLRNIGSIIDTIHSIKIYAACDKGSLINGSSGWTITSSENASNSNKLDITFTYDTGAYDISSLTGSVNIGQVASISTNVDTSNIIIEWKRTLSGQTNYINNTESNSTLFYKFSNLTFNNNIIFTSSKYVMNFGKTFPQEYSPNKTIISSNIIENGHNIVQIGSITIGSGTWYVTANGGFDLTNKKYFFFSDVEATNIDINNLKTNNYLMSSFGTHFVTAYNISTVNTAMIYSSSNTTTTIYWCFTCESSSASNTIFNSSIVSTNDYVHGRENNLVINALKIS
jgi:hypothetical protein